MRYQLGFDGTGEQERRLCLRLALAVAEAEGGRPEDALDAACAVEIVYQFSLVHDDIEDGVPVRSGRDAVWSKFGLAHAINAGDALCAVAYLALLEGAAPRSPEQTVAMTRVLLEAQLAMCGAQARTIAGAAIDAKVALLGAACELGAVSAGAGSERANAYARLGRAYATACTTASAEADALAASFGLDRDGRVRSLFAHPPG
ncbi:MAG: polyprenyl synthetase [Candidatus Eremiobacteraeota bacterium]|nr:polyprenyl synthetase [Candidatus Eremiobacteraeota bacterium]